MYFFTNYFQSRLNYNKRMTVPSSTILSRQVENIISKDEYVCIWTLLWCKTMKMAQAYMSFLIPVTFFLL